VGRASAPHESSDNLNNINGLQFYHSIRGNLQNLPFCSKKRVAEEVEHDKQYTKLWCASLSALRGYARRLSRRPYEPEYDRGC
jgi:predicted nucleotidyltransferase